MISTPNMRSQPGPSRLALGLLALAVISSVMMLARQQQLLKPTEAVTRPFESPCMTPSRPSTYDWAHRHLKHAIPEEDMTTLPQGRPLELAPIQHDFSADLGTELKRSLHRSPETNARQQAVKQAFQKTWAAYREHAWGCDELRPISQLCANPLNGWGATIVESLDTLWIMGMHDEFEEAVSFVSSIDWNESTQSRFSPFEVSSRYLGGLLSAYDLSENRVLLDKAVELGDMLYAAFDTPDHLPPFDLSFDDLRSGNVMPDPYQSAAALGGMALEFTRLSQVTGNDKYYDAVNRIKNLFADIQGSTLLPGLWPEYVNVANDNNAPVNHFAMGGDSNVLYADMPRMHALLGGLDPAYGHMYRRASAAARNNLLFRPAAPLHDGGAVPGDVLFLGNAIVDQDSGDVMHVPEVDTQGCSLGGALALAGRLLSRPDDVAIGEQLTRGCAWAHASTPSGLMPEKTQLLACPTLDGCARDESRGLAERDAAIDDSRSLLRPETTQSLFVLYRVTGKPDLRDAAWDIFTAMGRTLGCEGDVLAAIADVSSPAPGRLDELRPAATQTLKYLYLLFSDPDFMSLDTWVFSAEGHPFRRPG